jgi:hypothetical protein
MLSNVGAAGRATCSDNLKAGTIVPAHPGAKFVALSGTNRPAAHVENLVRPPHIGTNPC